MVSIIVPVYNAERYLEECIESILEQTYTDWELILVDDGSTDSSGAIVNRYAACDERIKAFHVDNGGPGKARNIGVKNACGVFFMFVDADDTLFPWSIQCLYDALEHTDADMVVGNYVSGTKENLQYHKTSPPVVFSGKQATERLLYQDRITSAPWAKLYRSELFDTLRFEDYACYEDLELIYRQLLVCLKVAYIDVSVYFYRNTPGSLINTWNVRRLDVLTVTEKIEEYMTAHHPRLVKAARDRRLSANFNIFALAWLNGEKDVADRCWAIVRSYRRESLFNPHVRLKNKAGIILSFFGKKVFGLVARFVY